MKLTQTFVFAAVLFMSSCSKTLEKYLPDLSDHEPVEVPVPIPPENKNVYFISNTGNSTNSGHTPQKAWDLSTANQFQFSPGDTINIVGTIEGTLSITESGLAEHPITIQGDTLYGNGQNALYIYNADYISVRNIHLQGNSEMKSDPKDAGIFMLTDDNQRHGHIVLEKVIAKGFGLAGIHSEIGMEPGVSWISEAASIAYQGGFDDIRINGCITDSNGFAGINITGSWPGKQNRDIVIINSSSSHNRGIKGMQPHTGNGIIISNTSGGLIDSCTASYNGWEYGHANVGIWTYTADHITMQHSSSFRNKSTTSSDGGGFDIDGGTANCIMQYNISYENDGAGFLVYEFGDPNKMMENTVRYNIAQNNGRKNKQYGGITFGGLAPQWDLHIYNNTILQDEGQAISKLGLTVNGVFEIINNILSSPKLSVLSKTATNNITGNALLNSNYLPLDNSPVIDGGMELENLPSVDYYGKGINNKRDIGAVEH
jgi:hypothetical protein